jgi:hypothetical protein
MTPFLLIAAAALGVCKGQDLTNPAATVLTLTGEVSVMRDHMPWALQQGDTVRPGYIIVTGPDSFAEFRVSSDGSTFQVFPNSRVVFRQNPSSWRDLLELLLGQVKVYIQKLGNQPNPNKVTTPTAVISVRGTIFDVAVEDDTDSTFVSVDEGQVEVEHRIHPDSKGRLLNPGDSIRVIKNQPLAKSVDKGSIMQGVLRAAADAIYQIVYRSSRPSVGGTTLPGGASGDTPKPAPPTTTPAPPATLPPPPPPQ